LRAARTSAAISTRVSTTCWSLRLAPSALNTADAYCYNLGYKYLGVQYASQCFCGNKYGRYGKGAAHTCSMACNGKKDEICGGVWRNNVYATGREAEEFHSIGCYHDKASGAITLNNCRLECASYGFLYFGVQNSNLCFCGNKYGRYGKAADGACNKQCMATRSRPAAVYFLNSIYLPMWR
uniref:WSC domain-containing protein n=1 Tax=Macrostomum lignano TaxID=282301 RepID=A0A1I8HPB6_9PLAT